MEAVLTGPMGRTLLGSSEVTIGCDADNSIIIADLRTSAHHALVRPDGAGYAIIDLGSDYGTIVNGRWLEPRKAQPLLPGDVIQIGDTRLTFELFQNPAAIPAGPLGVGVGSPARMDGGNAPLPAFPQRPDIADQDTAWIHRSRDRARSAAPKASPRIALSSLLDRLQTGPVPSYASQPWVPDGATTYPSQQQLWQQDRRRLTLALAIILVVLLISSLISLFVTRSTPDRTLDTFCNALVAGNEQLAISQLSANLQNQQGSTLTELLVVNKITTCAHTPAIIKGSSAVATLTVTFPSNAGAANNQNKTLVMLIQDASGTWKINALQNSLQGGGKPRPYPASRQLKHSLG